MLCHRARSSPPCLSLAHDTTQDAPYLDVAPYMPEYYKPQYLLDFEDRLPSSVHGSDSLSLNSFNSVTSTNLEWDDSAIAPSSEGKWRRKSRLALGRGRKPGLLPGIAPALMSWEPTLAKAHLALCEERDCTRRVWALLGLDKKMNAQLLPAGARISAPAAPAGR